MYMYYNLTLSAVEFITRDRGLRKGKKRKKSSHHLTELKEKTKRLESEKAQLLQRLLHSR